MALVNDIRKVAVFVTLLSFSCLFCCSKVYCQSVLSSNPRFENYNRHNHFTSTFCYQVYRDRKGYVWVPANGLYRFDGLQFRHYTNLNYENQSKLKDNFIAGVHEDNYNRLWIDGAGGLGYYDYSRDSFVYVNPDKQHPIKFSYSFCELNNKLWFISNYGLCNIDLETLKISYSSISSLQYPSGTFAVDNNTLIVSSYDETYIYSIKENRYIKRPLFRAMHFGATIKNKKGWYWGGYYGLSTVHSISDTPRIVPGTEQLAISAVVQFPEYGGDSILWLGTDNGIRLFNINSNRFVYTFRHDDNNPNSLQSNEITSLFIDKDRLLWIGTGSGISLFNIVNQTIKTHLFNSDYVFRVAGDKYDPSIAWASTVHKGLLKIDWNTQNVLATYTDIFGNNGPIFEIKNMIQLGKQDWLLTNLNEIILWNNAKNEVTRIGNFPVSPRQKELLTIQHIIPVDSNKFYVTTTQGLFLYNNVDKIIKPVVVRNDHKENSILDLRNGFYDGKEYLWIATGEGIIKFDTRSGNWRSYRIDDTVDARRANIFTSLAADGKGNIYCCSYRGMGILNINSNKFSLLDTFSNILTPICYSIKFINNIAWINSNAGLIGYDINRHQTKIIIPEHLLSYSVEPFGQVNDELVLCLREGYCYFQPSGFLKWPLPSAPVIEMIKVNNKKISGFNSSGTIKLRYFENNLDIAFTAFEFIDPEHIRFRYRLKGLEKNWHYTDEVRTANYSQLPGGNYRFEVQSGNSRGEWNAGVAHITVKIVPPFWETLWFRLSVVLLLIGAIIGAAVWRIRQIKLREERKTAVNTTVAELEMKVLRSQMNPHFIFNSLNSIQKFIWENKQEDAAEYLTKFSKLMRSILDNSMNKLITLEEELNTLILYIELEHRRSNNKFDYDIVVNDAVDIAHILVPPLIIQPYVENAIWHGLLNKPSRGKLRINIQQENEDELLVIIEDNGVGRTYAGNKTGERNGGKRASYGMQITAQRLSMSQANNGKGQVFVEDLYEEDSAAGTRVTIKLPVISFIKV